MVWYQHRYKVVRGKTIRTGGVIYKHLEDARKEARRQLSIRDDIKDNRIEIWTTHGINESPSREDNMFVEAVERRLKSNYTKKKTPKTNEFGLNWNLR